MLEESDLCSLLQYFYFLFLEPEKAQGVCRSVQIYAQSRLKCTDLESRRSFCIRLSYELSQKIKKRIPSERTLSNLEKQGWQLPDNFYWEAWFHLLKKVRIEELHSLIWVSVLGSPVSAVSQSLRIKEETIIYRLSQAHKSLSHILACEVQE